MSSPLGLGTVGRTEEHKRHYYIDPDTKETTWDMPVEYSWEELKDADGTGNIYYHNKKTGVRHRAQDLHLKCTILIFHLSLSLFLLFRKRLGRSQLNLGGLDTYTRRSFSSFLFHIL